MKNSDKKVSFPEYKEKKIQQEQIRITKAKKKEEKQRNSLPPFLMVRSGLFDKTAVTALFVVPTSAYLLQYDHFLADFIVCCMWTLMMAVFLCDITFMNYEKRDITSNVEDYICKLNARWQPIANYNYKRLAENIVKWKSKNDTRLFNRFINRPDEIYDERSATAIIQGYLKSHPEDADKILEKFDIATLPSKVLKSIKKCKQK